MTPFPPSLGPPPGLACPWDHLAAAPPRLGALASWLPPCLARPRQQLRLAPVASPPVHPKECQPNPAGPVRLPCATSSSPTELVGLCCGMGRAALGASPCAGAVPPPLTPPPPPTAAPPNDRSDTTTQDQATKAPPRTSAPNDDAMDAARDADDGLKRKQQSLSPAKMAMETMVPIRTASAIRMKSAEAREQRRRWQASTPIAQNLRETRKCCLQTIFWSARRLFCLRDDF